MDILIEQELALHKQEIRQNLAEVSRLLSPSFREVGESGTSYDFQSIIDMMSQEEKSTGYIHAQDFDCIQLESSVHLLLYRSAWVDEEGVASHFAKRSSIWVFTGENWQMKYHQGTSCEAFEFRQTPSVVSVMTKSLGS